jgi:hypothetical protein
VTRNFISALAAMFAGAGAGVTRSFYPNAHCGAALRGEAEQTFRLGRGAGRKLMTQAEWREHQQKMKGRGAGRGNRRDPGRAGSGKAPGCTDNRR